MKICTKCKIEKDESEYYKHKQNSDGLFSLCKVCSRLYQKQYKERKKIYMQGYNQRSEIKARAKEYCKTNKDKIKKYREDNKDKINAVRRQHCLEHRAEIYKKRKYI